MAATYTPRDAFETCKRYVKNMPLEKINTIGLLDDVCKILWMAAPWRWTIGSLTTVTLSANTSTYALGTLPTDFLYTIHAYIVSTGSDGDVTVRRLNIEPFQPTDPLITGQPNAVYITGAAGAAGTVYLSPKIGTLASGSTNKLVMLYKKTAPLVDNQTQYTAGLLVMDDEWFWVYTSGVLWLAYLFADDQRAGTAQFDVSSRRYSFTGQRAVFEANMEIMRQREKLPEWNLRLIPDAGLKETA